MYDSLSADYDRFVHWPGRLAYEMPFIETRLQPLAADSRPVRVLDVACGTGMHTIELARRGYRSVGADLSAGMIAKARQNAQAAGVQVDFQAVGFGELVDRFRGFDAVLCLGNSLPHLLDEAALASALQDFNDCLRPGGLLLIQNRNFDAVLASQQRWMSPEAHSEGDQEWIFWRFYDFDPDGLLSFHLLTLTRSGTAPWQQKVDSTRLYPQREELLADALKAAGFTKQSVFGDLAANPFDPMTSSNLVIAAYSNTTNGSQIEE